MTPEPSINFKCQGGAEFDAQLDGDGDLYVSVTNDTMAAMYLSGPEAVALRDWLIRTLPASGLETCECCTPERKCPDHGGCVTDGEV